MEITREKFVGSVMLTFGFATMGFIYHQRLTVNTHHDGDTVKCTTGLAKSKYQ
jgi:hypothetical protein